MEKILSQEERIRRAEEIYSRRRNNISKKVRVSSDTVNVSKSRLSLFKKLALQLAICAVIYIIFYLIKNTNYIFSESVINKTKEFLAYDINFENISSQVNLFIENNKDKFNFTNFTQNDANEEESIGENKGTNEGSNETVNEVLNEILNELSNEISNEVSNSDTNNTNELNEVNSNSLRSWGS